MKTEVSSQAAKFFQDLLSSDSDQDDPPKKQEIKVIEEPPPFLDLVRDAKEDQITPCFLENKVTHKEQIKKPETAPQIQVMTTQVFEEPQSGGQVKDQNTANLFAEDDSLEINLDSVLFSNTALCLQNDLQREKNTPLIVQAVQEEPAEISVPKQPPQQKQPNTLDELQNSIQQYILDYKKADLVVQSIKRHKTDQNLKELVVKALQEKKEVPGLSLKESYARVLTRQMQHHKSSEPRTTQFTSLQNQVQIPHKIQHLPELLILSIIEGNCNCEDLINSYTESTYSLSDPFFVLVKLYLNKHEQLLSNKNFFAQFKLNFYLPYFQKMNSAMSKKIKKFWSLLLLRYMGLLEFSDLLSIGLCLGFNEVREQIVKRINSADNIQKKKELESIYRLVNQDLSPQERTHKLYKEESERIHLPNQPLHIKQVKRVEKPLPIEKPKIQKVEEQPQQPEVLQKHVEPVPLKSTGFMGFFKKLVSTDQPVKRPPPEVKKQKPAYYYDHELKTWIINGKPADNEHDDNILGLDEVKNPENLVQPKEEPHQVVPPSIQSSKPKPPPKFKFQEKKASDSKPSEAAPPPPPPPPPSKFSQFPKPFQAGGPSQRKEDPGKPSISNPFSFSQNKGPKKIQNSRIRNLGSRYANPF